MPRLQDPGVGTIESGRRLFEILDSDLKAETFRRGMPQEYANGAYLIQQGEKADGIHIITVGTVESLYQSNLGRSLILATWEAGDFVGGPYVFGDHEHAWAARALGRVQALHLNQNQLKSFATESASFALAMIECLGYKGERYSKLAQNLATHNSTERLALLLAELAKHAPPAVDGTKRIDETIEVLTTYEGGKLSAPMAGLVRNGFAIKIGYGSKNESIPGFEVQRFWIENQADAIGYLVAVKEAFIAGEVNENLEEMLEGYRVRAEKGEEARRAKKELAQAA